MPWVTRLGCCTHCCTAAHLPDESSQAGGSPQLLALRWLSPREPAIPVAYALTQLGPSNIELSVAGGSAGGGAFQAFVPLTSFPPNVLLARLLSEHDGPLICAICSDAPRYVGVMLTVSPKQPSATLSHDLMILSDLHPHLLPAQSGTSERPSGRRLGADIGELHGVLTRPPLIPMPSSPASASLNNQALFLAVLGRLEDNAMGFRHLSVSARF
jgi:hypothetical protein